jgi:hypothetical protein
MALVTVHVPVSITETVLPFSFDTYAFAAYAGTAATNQAANPRSRQHRDICDFSTLSNGNSTTTSDIPSSITPF